MFIYEHGCRVTPPDARRASLPPSFVTSPMAEKTTERQHEEQRQKEEVPAADDEQHSGEHQAP
jgi:hypothetical protein